MKYTYLIDPANRGDLVEEVFKKRKEWKNGIPVKFQNKPWKVLNEEIVKNNWNFVWKQTVSLTLKNNKQNLYNIIDFSKQSVKFINHFPNPDIITRKTNLVRSLRKYIHNPYEIIPKTYILNDENNEIEIFLKDLEKSTKDIWIVKPEYLYSGQGIELFDNLEDIVNHIDNVQKKGKDEWVIQKYINNPLLMNGRKFDIRINVLVTKDFDIYVNPNGFIRTISSLYYPFLTGDKFKDKLTHITNHSVQKLSPDFGKYEEGNVLSMEYLKDYLDKNFENGDELFHKTIFSQIFEIVKIVILSSKDEIYKNTKLTKNQFNNENLQCFELFGFDFLIDENFKVWLLEVNTNTGLEQDNSWALKIVKNMLEEMIQITVDSFLYKSYTKDKEYKSWIKI